MGLFDSLKDQAEDMTGMDLDNLDLDGLMEKLPDNLSEVFDNDFIKNNSSFESIQALLSAGGFKAENLTDLKNLPLDKLNGLIGDKTNFGNLQEMLMQAASKFMK